MSDSDLEARAKTYVQGLNATLDGKLGSGQDGMVWLSSLKTAVKAFSRASGYDNEVGAYLRLREFGVTTINGFAVPALVSFSEDLMIVEMEFVSPPFLLDFGKAYLDRKPEFSDEVWRDWRQQCKDLFDERWPKVLGLVRALERYGIYYLDVKPGNIMFEDEP